MSQKSEEELERVRQRIEGGLADVRGAEGAEKTWDQIEAASGGLDRVDVAPGGDRLPCDPATGTENRSAKELLEVGEEVARTPVDRAGELDQAVAAASDEDDPEVRRGRELLRAELIERLGPLDGADTRAFLAINGLPRSPLANAAFRKFSFMMTGGHAWILVPLVAALWDPRRARRAVVDVMPPLWLATAFVEYLIKPYFRRHRPFITLVDAVVVGRKPGSYSFPSGHSAAAFAGAMLLASRYPKGRAAFFAVAGLVGFSRVYLGAHYPGDVVTGGVAGTSLAGIFRAILRRSL